MSARQLHRAGLRFSRKAHDLPVRRTWYLPALA